MAFLRGWKPLPKVLILASPIALAVWAFIQFGPQPAPAVVQATPIAVPAESTQAAAESAVAAATRAASQVDAAPALLVPAGGYDAGLSNVIKAGSK